MNPEKGQEMDNDAVPILTDMALTMAVTTMAKACTKTEIEKYFKNNRQRLLKQGFTDKSIDRYASPLKEAVAELKETMGVKP